MHKKNRLIIPILILVPFIFTGCGDSKVNKNLDIVEEWTTTDDEIKKEDDVIDKNNDEKDSMDNSNKDNTETDSNSNKDNTEIKNEDKNSNLSSNEIILVENPIFIKSEISDEVKTRMMGKSMPEDATISFDELSYLTITYLDYNGTTKQGEMVVHNQLADEVLDIFKDIYKAKFPIEKMKLVDDYNASDHSSMVNNNTSAFCYRTIAGSNKVSNHGKGLAIDINPFYNPHVLKSSGKVNPPEASKYADRTLNAKGMIKYNDVVYKAFISRGWTWGGNWNNPDYQHFEKSI